MGSRCLVCDSTDKWKNVDEHTIKPNGLHICQGCGFVTYPDRISSKEKLKEYYDKEYRAIPNINNIYTGQTKLHYHSAFLTDLIREWNKTGKKREVFEIGAALGMFLNWIRGSLKDCTVEGTEWAEAYRRNAWHEYGVKLGIDFDDSKKYDLICTYKVAEHQIDADKELRLYAECLKPEGFLYVSVPTWFTTMSNPGKAGWDLSYHYHPDHINVWTRKLFEVVLKKSGLETVKFNDTYYGETYLCKRNDSLMKEKPVYESADEIIKIMVKIKQATELTESNPPQFSKAIEVFPNFPFAHQGLYELNRAEFHDKGWDHIKEEFIEKSFTACGNNGETLLFGVQLAMRYDKFEYALELCENLMETKPNNIEGLLNLSLIFRHMAKDEQDPRQKMRLLLESREVCRYLKSTGMRAKPEAINWMLRDQSELPIPGEPAYELLKEVSNEKTMAKQDVNTKPSGRSVSADLHSVL